MVKLQEKEAVEQAEKSQAIAADAQRDLDEALPALEAAVASLKSLNKGDVTEVCLCLLIIFNKQEIIYCIIKVF